MLVGLLDDLFGVSPMLKILVQAAAGLYLYHNGYQIRLISNPLGDTINLGVLSLPITLLWFAGMSNAFNLIDGLDGLAAGVGLFSTSIVLHPGLDERPLGDRDALRGPGRRAARLPALQLRRRQRLPRRLAARSSWGSRWPPWPCAAR